MMGVGEIPPGAEASLSDQIDGFFERLASHLRPDDLAGRLKLRRQVIDHHELRFSSEAAAFVATEDFENDDATTATNWFRHNCKMSFGTAVDRLNVGEQLNRLPQSAQAMLAGEIGFAHLSVMARTVNAIAESSTAGSVTPGCAGPESATPEAAAPDCAAPATGFDESDLLDQARGSTPGRLWHYCVRLRHALDPEAVAAAQRIAAEERRLQLSPLEDGSVLISGQFDSIGGAALRTALEPLARPMGEGDDRDLERRQADALVELASLSLDSGRLPHVASQRPHLQVTTTLETLRGLVGSPAADMEFALPISAKTVQRLAYDAAISRVVFGPESVVIDAGRARRVVSSPTRRALNARDQHCQWPGCERAASRSAAHHLVHWVEGGATDLSNLILLCHRHHWMTHEGGWKLARATDERLLAIPPTYAYYHPARAPDDSAAA